MMTLTPRLLVAIVLLWAVTVVVQSRPATDSGEPEIEESAELSPDPSVVMVPIRQLMDPNSAFTRILNNQLLKMSEQDLQAFETRLSGTKTKPVSDDDQDMMMGDMPSADDPQDSSSPATMLGRATVMPENYSDEMSHRENPESEDPEVRQQRIEDIQRHMINSTGRKPILPPIPVTKTGPILSYPSDTFKEKTQSFYSTCDLPKHTDEDVWNSKISMNLMFNISLPKSSKGITVNVNTARLRLYKQFVSCYSQSSNETDDSQLCQPALYVENKKQSNLTTAGVVPIIMDDRQIRVSIYLNIRSLKRKRAIKRKLLDSRMMPYFSEKWTEWNIRNAAKAWHRNPVRNYGISIEVEDENGDMLPVAKFFRPMNCSGDAQMMTSKPVQGLLMEAEQNGYGNPTATTNQSNTNTVDTTAFRFNMHGYPIMDVTTVELTESEAKNAMIYLYAKNSLEQVGSRGAGSSFNGSVLSDPPSDTFTEKTQSFYPTCDLPKHTDEDVWNERKSMNLMFNISLPKSSKGITVNVNTARLRLYKQFVSCYSQSSNETDDSQLCQPASYVENKKQSNLTTAGVVPIIMDDRQIRVSIYLNIRSLKRKRAIKRKLLDSRMMPYFSEKWTEWNIRNAAKAWHRNPVRNYGISIEVEDENGDLLPVTKFFRPMNCSGDAQMMTSKPVQGLLMEAVHNSYGVPVRNPTTTGNHSTRADDALTLNINMHMYPILDVTTVEVPESEANHAMLYQYTKNTLEQVGGRGAVSSSNWSPGQEYMVAEFQHRIRYGSQHRNNGTIPGSLSIDGHEHDPILKA